MMISSETHFDPEGVEFEVTTVPEGVDIHRVLHMIDERDIEGTEFTDIVIDINGREILHFFPFETEIN